MKVSSVTKFFTTSIANSNRVEQFADQYLLAPLHYLLNQRQGRVVYPETYRIGEAREFVKLPRPPIDSTTVRIIKIFAACIGALLLTLPGALVKRIAQFEASSIAKHKALESYPKRKLFFDAGLLSKHLIPFLGVREVTALIQTQRGPLFRIDAPQVKSGERRDDVVQRVEKRWVGFFDHNELAIWRAVAQRFPDYKPLKERDTPISNIPRDLVKSKFEGILRLREEWRRRNFDHGDQFFALIGGVERFLMLPHGSDYPEQTLNLLSSIHRCSEFGMQGTEIGFTIRVIRKLNNPIRMQPVDNPGGHIFQGLPQKWEPKEEIVRIRFEVRVPDQGDGRRNLAIRARLWPSYGDEMGRDRPFEKRSEQLESWTSPEGSKWLDNLLAGNVCGRFPHQQYMTSSYELPDVTYRLCPPGYQAQHPDIQVIS